MKYHILYSESLINWRNIL